MAIGNKMTVTTATAAVTTTATTTVSIKKLKVFHQDVDYI